MERPDSCGSAAGAAEIENECEEDFAQIYARALEVQKNAGAKLVSRPGTNQITMAEIDEEIAAHRREKRL